MSVAASATRAAASPNDHHDTAGGVPPPARPRGRPHGDAKTLDAKILDLDVEMLVVGYLSAAAALDERGIAVTTVHLDGRGPAPAGAAGPGAALAAGDDVGRAIPAVFGDRRRSVLAQLARFAVPEPW